MISRYLHNASRLSNRPALRLLEESGTQEFSYGDVFRAARRIADFLESAAPSGSPVAILCRYDPYWVMLFFGIYLSGRTVVPLDILLSTEEVANLVRHSGAGLVFADAANREKLAGATAALVDPHEAGLFHHAPGTEDGPGGAPVHAPAAEPMVIIYTSGTTGDPKGVMLGEENFRAELDALLELVPVGEDDHLLSVLPLHHVLALLTGVLAPLYVGCRVTFLSTLERARVLAALRTELVTIFVCVPQFFYLLHGHVWAEIRRKPALVRYLFRGLMQANGSLRENGMNLGRWLFPAIHAAFGPKFRFFAAGGSYFDPKVIRDLAAWGLNVVQAYGLTETSGACTATPLDAQCWGSVGRPLPGVELCVLHASPQGEGEIAVRGPVVMSGYFRSPEQTREIFSNGWMLTGDLGYRDSRGFYHITGRSKEVIVLASGKNVYPEELERYYSTHPSIREVAVLSRPGPAGDEQLYAVVVPDFDYLKAQKIANSAEVVRFELENLAAALPGYKRLTGLQIRAEPLPRTTTRKLKRRELQEQLERQQREAPPAAPAWAAPGGAVEEQVRRFLAELGKTPASLVPESNLELDLGLDSLQRVELLSHLESVFATPVGPEEAAAIYTLQDLARVFDARGTAPRPGPGGRDWARLLSEPEPEVEPFLRSRPLSHVVVDLLRLFFRHCIGRPFFRLEVTGLEHLPAAGPYLICPNHLSYLDGLFFESVFPRHVFHRVFYLGHSDYFQAGFCRRFAQWIHIVPLDPDTHLIRALRAGAMGLREKRILCIFPEGSRSIDGRVKEFRHGASILAREVPAPVVPAAIAGTFEVLPRLGSRLRRHPVRIVFGRPIDPGTCSSYAELTALLQQSVEGLFEMARSGMGGGTGSRNGV